MSAASFAATATLARDRYGSSSTTTTATSTTTNAATTMRRTVPFPLHDDSNDQQPITVPAGHFLAQNARQEPLQQSFEQSATRLATTLTTRAANATDDDEWRQRGRPDTSSLAAADFDVSVETGFLPPDEPVQSLDVPGWDMLEQLLQRTQKHVSTLAGGGLGRLPEEWRRQVEQLPPVSVDYLTSLPMYRRAHVVLSYLGHFYMHSTYPSQSTVPASIARPWVQVSEQLSLPPILTYADTVLWNWRFIDPTRGFQPDNVAINTMFTNSPSEHAFFMLSLLCEMHGPHILRLMSATLDEAFFADTVSIERISSYLSQMTVSINELTMLMRQATKGQFGNVMNPERIVPEVFYWQVRPWFNGGKWLFEHAGQDGNSVEMEWGGPSAGQSSLVHALDLFLGVDHSPRPARNTDQPQVTASSSTISTTTDVVHSSTRAMDASAPLPPSSHLSTSTKPVSVPLSDSTFMARMSHYMPGFHREFLQHLNSLHVPSSSTPFPVASVRQLAQQFSTTRLGTSYDEAVQSMKLFRDEHMRLATVFIIQQARREPGRDTVFWNEWQIKQLALQEQQETLKGTGGTDLVVFLKRCRDRTKEAFLDKQACA
ncbi:hypothetical protein OIO90_002689 [Microbotryomycetes sp. JL221]|nr:hypothetical protein OIO90_002689 [Microbotryomycetes sp. JL221]